MARTATLALLLLLLAPAGALNSLSAGLHAAGPGGEGPRPAEPAGEQDDHLDGGLDGMAFAQTSVRAERAPEVALDAPFYAFDDDVEGEVQLTAPWEEAEL
mmetsp:Transcript_91375/g.238029  ORF Transcript_91375/g.238029 Transcript_91375/m.238029 type:complete len:101 (-) Transcript_91375:109-411(-)